MTLREWINKRPLVASFLTLLLLAAAIAAIYVEYKRAKTATYVGPHRVYFYDLSTHQLLVDTNEKLPPLDEPGKVGAVRAFVYACGQCTPAGRDAQHIARLEKYTDNAKSLLARGEPQPASTTQPMNTRNDPVAVGDLVSAPDPVKWYPIYSPQGRKIKEESYAKCPKETPLHWCDPGP